MNSRFIILIWLLVLSLFFTEFASAQKDPQDPGFADTLYFEAGEPSSENGDTLFIPSDTSGGDVTIYIKVWNDNPVAGFSVPLIDTCGVGFLDPAKNNDGSPPVCFEDSRVEDFDLLTIELSLNPDSHTVLYGAVSFADTLGSGDGLFARMIYTIPPGTSSACICLDTSFLPPGNILTFVRTDAIGYVPFLKKRCFQVALRKQTDVPEIDSKKGFNFDLKQNYPNPFNSLTAIPFTVHSKQSTVNNSVRINVSIYNILGQKVRTLLDQKKAPGEYRVLWDGKDESGKDVGSGIYFCKLSCGDLVSIKKMILLR